MKNNRTFRARCYFLFFLIAMAFVCGNAYAQPPEPAGHVIFVHDTVWRMTADETRLPLNKGDSVYETDTITTGLKGSAQLLMVDGAYIAIRPNTTIRLDVYHYDKDEEKGLGESVISLLKGCFRSITGMIGKENKENYRIKTPVASIGIRGTDHEPLYIPIPEEGEIPIGDPGLYDKVNSGETYIENDAGVVTVLPNQVGYVSDRFSLAVVDETIPDVYEQYSGTGSGDSVDASEEQESETRMSSEDLDGFSVTASLDEQDSAQVFAPVAPELGERPIRYYGVFTWPDVVSYQKYFGFTADETEITTDDSGNLTGYYLLDLDSPNPDWLQSMYLVNPVDATHGESDHYSETTISFGTWKADNVETVSYGGTTDTYPVGSGLVHWITGTLSDADYLSQVITGTQTYTFDGGTAPTNQNGIAGTLDTASLSVDFTRQALDVSIGLNVNNNDWSASATDIPIDRGLFSASSPILTVERNGDSTNTWGSINGAFAGDGLSGAFLAYTLGDPTISETVNGTASFYALPQDTDVTYREIGIAGTDLRPGMSEALALFSPSATTRIGLDGSGNLTGFDAMLTQYGTTPADDARYPVHLDVGSATLTDTGMDADSGVSWGRWSGTITATDRLSDTEADVVPSFDPQELHYIAGPEMSSPVNLPIIGTKTYQFAGGTNPTDNLGNVGTLNSASLSANFTDMTVATGINATVNAVTFDAHSTATPIEGGRYFNATTGDSLTLSCNVGDTQTGSISGSFYGANGESAGMVYSFNTTNNTDINTTISGAAAFK